MPDPNDELDQPVVSSDDASGTPPVAKTPDLEAIVKAAIEENLNTRFSGLQSVMDKRIAALAKELKRSSLTDEEQQQALQQEQSRETARALQIAELIKRRATRPEAVDFLIESMQKEDLDDQLEFIQSKIVAKAAAQAVTQTDLATPGNGDASDDGAPVPDVDKNNPASRRAGALLEGDMNEETADAILNRVGRGQFRDFLKRG